MVISWLSLGFLLIGVVASQDCPSNKIITALSGNITSPQYPARYPANQSCSWTIVAPPGKHIKLHYQTLEIEDCGYDCNCDKLEMAIGKTSSLRKSVMCRDRHDTYKDFFKPFYSVFNTIWLNFTSDDSPDPQYQGFFATFEQISYAPPVCPKDAVVLSGNTGSVASPNYPNKYPNSRVCYWLITVSDGPRVKLNFTDFTLEESGCQAASEGNCNCDFVEVFDGETNATFGRHCRTALPKPVISNSKKMLVKFFSNNLEQFKGFHAVYTSTSEGATPTKAPPATQTPTTGPKGGSPTMTVSFAGLVTAIMALVVVFAM